MVRRPNLLLALGGLLVVLGVGLAWVVARDDEPTRASGLRPVLVATADLEPGQSGDDLVASGRVKVEQVEPDEVEPGALTSSAELSGTIVGTPVAEGAQVVAEAVRSSVLRGEAIEIPDGQEAVAVTVPFTAGVAGYVGPGDRVNLYASIPPGTAGAPVSPRTELLLGGVEVLDVSQEVQPSRAAPVASADGAPPTQPARDRPEQVTLLLAVDATQAEQVVFASTNGELWFTLLAEGADPPETPGVDYRTYGPAEG